MNNCPIFLINLENRTDRLLKSINELRKVNLVNSITRIEAIDEYQAK